MIRAFICMVVATLTPLACHSGSRASAGVISPVRLTSAAPGSAPTRMPKAIGDFTVRANALASEDWNRSHTGIVRALRGLADALDAMPNKSPGVHLAAMRVRADATQLEHSPEPALSHTDITKFALETTTAALQPLASAAEPAAAVRRDLDAAQAALAQINVSIPLLRQRQSVLHAFRAVANAVASASAVSAREGFP